MTNIQSCPSIETILPSLSFYLYTGMISGRITSHSVLQLTHIVTYYINMIENHNKQASKEKNEICNTNRIFIENMSGIDIFFGQTLTDESIFLESYIPCSSYDCHRGHSIHYSWNKQTLLHSMTPNIRFSVAISCTDSTMNRGQSSIKFLHRRTQSRENSELNLSAKDELEEETNVSLTTPEEEDMESNEKCEEENRCIPGVWSSGMSIDHEGIYIVYLNKSNQEDTNDIITPIYIQIINEGLYIHIYIRSPIQVLSLLTTPIEVYDNSIVIMALDSIQKHLCRNRATEFCTCVFLHI